MPEYTTEDLDWIYGLPFSRKIPAHFPEFKMAQFSVVTHRGCVGRCSFCALALHQGDRIVSRSEKSILDEIRRLFYKISKGRKQHLKYYFMVAHPGSGPKEAKELAEEIQRLEGEGEKPVEGVQIFTPTPMTVSTCMYHTGLDPATGEKVYVARTFAEKKEQKRMLTT